MREAIQKLIGNGPPSNAGLFLAHYAEGMNAQGPVPAGRGEAQKKAIEACNKALLDPFYKAAFDRRCRAFTNGSAKTPCTSFDLPTAGRMLIGAGSENLLEVSIRLSHSYGVPLIPGTAIKGVTSHYCHDYWGTTDPQFARGGQYHNLLFGTTDDSGTIAFHDAWIKPGSGGLVADIITPHHPGWQDGTTPPSDFDSPVPVSFLSATGTFSFFISWHGPAGLDAAKVEKWLKLTKTLIQQTLGTAGVGAKTNSGYGRLAAMPKPKLEKNMRVDVEVTGPCEGSSKNYLVKYDENITGKLVDGIPEGTNLKPGDFVPVVVKAADTITNIQFRWPPTPRPGSK